MPSSIKFDNTEILSSTYIPRFIKHESAPERVLSILEPAREDGAILISDRYGTKKISLTGVLTASTAAGLETAIDTFKELFSRSEKNLDISWSSSTRRYVATCTKHDFDRDHFHLLFVPWTAEFTVLSGEGKDTAQTTALNEEVLTTTTPATKSFTMSGSKPAKPYIKIQGTNFPSSAKGLMLEDTDTGEKIVFTKNAAWGNTDVVEIKCDEKKVRANIASAVYTDQNFYGVFPKFRIGTNTLRISLGGIVNQECYDATPANFTNGALVLATTKRLAQSFEVPYGDDTFRGISLLLDKFGSPGNITVEIHTDGGNKPSGTPVTNASWTILPGDVSLSLDWVTKYSTSLFSLTANTRYWIVLSAAGVDVSNCYTWYFSQNGSPVAYAKGNRSLSDDSGSTYTDYPNDDHGFRIMYGGQPAASSVKLTVQYYPTYL